MIADSGRLNILYLLADLSKCDFPEMVANKYYIYNFGCLEEHLTHNHLLHLNARV
jgi:hypothetical protein